MNPPPPTALPKPKEDKAATVLSTGTAGDREVAKSVLKALHELQEAMDAAVLAGLIVEPSARLVAGRFREQGSEADSHLTRVHIFRKLA